MNRCNIIKAVLFSLVVCLLIGLSFSAESKSQNYKLFTQSLDGFGKRVQSDNYLLRIGSGGQPGAVGISEDPVCYALQGYVHATAFVHGDCDGNGVIGLPDVVYLINYALKGGPQPIPLETGDMDCPNNYIDLADVVYLINYVLRGGPAPCNL